MLLKFVIFYSSFSIFVKNNNLSEWIRKSTFVKSWFYMSLINMSSALKYLEIYYLPNYIRKKNLYKHITLGLRSVVKYNLLPISCLVKSLGMFLKHCSLCLFRLNQNIALILQVISFSKFSCLD